MKNTFKIISIVLITGLLASSCIEETFPKGSTLTKDQILSEVALSVPMFFEGGGVTFTGGEPTMRGDIATLVAYAEKIQ